MTKTVLLGEVTTFLARGASPKYTTSPETVVLNQKCIRGGRVVTTQAQYTDTKIKKISDERYLQPYDILINSTGQGTLGRVGQFFDSELPTTVDSHITIVRPDPEKVEPLFLGYSLISKQKEIERLAEGTTGQTELGRQKIRSLKVALPDIHDQKLAGKMLETFDKKIELNRRMNEKLEKIGQALFKHYFIDNPDRKNWENIQLREIIKIFSGYAFSSKDFSENGYGLVTIKNVQDGSFNTKCTNFLQNLDSKLPKNVFLNSGDIIISLTGNVGRVCFVYGQETFLLNQRVARLIPINDADLPFTYFLFRQKDFQDYLISISRGTAQQNLSPVDLSKTLIANSGKETRVKFAKVVSPIFKQLVINMNEVETLTNLRDSLLPRLISGNVKHA